MDRDYVKGAYSYGIDGKGRWIKLVSRSPLERTFWQKVRELFMKGKNYDDPDQ